MNHVCRLMRLDKPIGIFLLLWPTLWALWLASDGMPDIKLVSIFIAGTVLMRSAGCVMNDVADRHFDAHVERTRDRPLASGKISVKIACCLVAGLGLLALMLVMFCNALTIKLAFIGAGLAMVYPFLKRVTHLPQVGLGLAFAWGIPMAFAAVQNTIPLEAWLLYVACIVWVVMYDTLYAMVDRNDDVKIGIKSTAILFGHYDRAMIALLQFIFIVMMVRWVNAMALMLVLGLFLYQQLLIKKRERTHCFRAFLNNNWVGLITLIGIIIR